MIGGAECFIAEPDAVLGPADGKLRHYPRDEFVAAGIAEQNEIVVGDIDGCDRRVVLYARLAPEELCEEGTESVELLSSVFAGGRVERRSGWAHAEEGIQEGVVNGA